MSSFTLIGWKAWKINMSSTIKNRLDKLEEKLNRTEVLTSDTKATIITALAKEEYIENNADKEDKALIIKWQNKLGKKRFKEEFTSKPFKTLPEEVVNARFKKGNEK